MITLTVSRSAAVVQRGGTAQHWLGEAAAIAARVPDQPMDTWQSFSTTNVNIWRVSVGVERGEAGAAMLKLAEPVTLDGLDQRSSRRADFLADMGRGLARDPRTQADAVRWLRQAEDAAPQRIRNSAPVRETVAYLLNRARALWNPTRIRTISPRFPRCRIAACLAGWLGAELLRSGLQVVEAQSAAALSAASRTAAPDPYMR
jgi:hypothetical protein